MTEMQAVLIVVGVIALSFVVVFGGTALATRLSLPRKPPGHAGRR